MKLSVRAFALAAATLWGLGMLVTTSANMLSPGYASAFLEIISSIYPGFEPGQGVKSIVVGTLYGIVDAGIAGAIFAWLYNLLQK